MYALGQFVGAIIVTFLLSRLVPKRSKKSVLIGYLVLWCVMMALGTFGFGSFIAPLINYTPCLCIWLAYDLYRFARRASEQKAAG